MKEEKNIVSIQGYEGSFHHQAAMTYFQGLEVECIPADSFDILAKQLANRRSHFAVMAIENSIAGSILQNYRILREYGFWIFGECYLHIQHCLLANHGTKMQDIEMVYSHPMALNQCLNFLQEKLQHAKLIETEDTALAAMKLAASPNSKSACVASVHASKITGLEILQKGIEMNKENYTRFFILSRDEMALGDAINKASLYFRIPDKKGQLLKVLEIIKNYDMNMSKLQSFPVAGSFREYYFYLDVEFDKLDQYYLLQDEMEAVTLDFNRLGLYKRADLEIIHHKNNSLNTSQ